MSTPKFDNSKFLPVYNEICDNIDYFFKGLKDKIKYYVHIRMYKTINCKNYYSAWAKSKIITTKK